MAQEDFFLRKNFHQGGGPDPRSTAAIVTQNVVGVAPFWEPLPSSEYRGNSFMKMELTKKSTKCFAIILLALLMFVEGGASAGDLGERFPFSGWTRSSERRARTVSCVENCICSDVHDSYFIIDCSLAGNGIGVVRASPMPILSNVSRSKEIRLLITGSELEKLHEKAFHGFEFDKIHIKYNHGLSSIPNHVFEESKNVLSVLDLRNNNFSAFPFVNLSAFQTLEFLSLDDNIIREIPGHISNHDKLVHLAVANNRISKLEEGSLTNLHQLKFLDLHGNQLTTLSSPFHRLNSLHSLILYDNPLRTIQSGVLQELVSLKVLDLSLCSLKILPSGSLAVHSSEPLFVDLARNPLPSIDVAVFRPETLPLWLNLRGTGVNLLREEDLRPILEWMANSLIMHHRFGLPRVMLEDTELSCDCNAKWLATNVTLLERTEGLCVHKNVPLRRLDPDYFYRFCF